MQEQVLMADILKQEGTRLTRTTAPAAAGTKIGTPVLFPLRNQKLIALSNEADGVVIVQPHNAVVDLTFTQAADIGDLDAFIKEGDAHGIVYIGTPIAAENAGTGI